MRLSIAVPIKATRRIFSCLSEIKEIKRINYEPSQTQSRNTQIVKIETTIIEC